MTRKEERRYGSMLRRELEVNLMMRNCRFPLLFTLVTKKAYQTNLQISQNQRAQKEVSKEDRRIIRCGI